MTAWVVAGAPLENGAGWRIWYGQPGHAPFGPQPVSLSLNGQPQAIRQSWQIQPDLPGLNWRMGVATVTLAVAQPGATYEIAIPEARNPEPFHWRSLPDRVGDEGVSFLLSSCFWRDNDREGTYAAGVRELVKRWRPAFRLLAGDQIYADWPSDKTPNVGKHAEVALYAKRYEEYWGDAAYRESLLASPNYFVCDDHEFWNDYPEKQLHLSRTWPAVRGAYARAAQLLYERFQQCLNPGGNPWYSFSIGTVSFFVTDSRSQRDFFDARKACHFLPARQWADLEKWAAALRGPGVLVLGQPLYQKDGDWRDHSLSNFADDYARLWKVIENSLRGKNRSATPHDILVLSGDIHTGRYAVGRHANLNAPEGVPELIASPAAMIDPGSKKPEEPPYRFQVKGQAIPWEVDKGPGFPFMTLDNNIAMVRMHPGTNNRTRFELSLWQVKPYDSRSWWDRLKGDPKPAGAVAQLFRREINLR